ncbi:cationic peroxidase SPC4-like [Phragmites australis]|uniref:cationic peroxidase SPC4-like n=1 Tax=Phragmites australis TaxID=29695 RepID=UPI002D78406D|nr:cationic peroxidase SPC4-like [Phragmites australis]
MMIALFARASHTRAGSSDPSSSAYSVASKMANRSRAAAVVLAISSLCAVLSSATVTVNEPLAAGLSWSFYDASCPSVEGIVRWHVTEALRRDVGIAAGLIRIFFHDCFPQGCDASLLLSGSSSEQSELPNQTLRPEALKLIDDIRAAVHSACGPKVSCADITTLATRDAVVASGGPFFEVPLGRRDGFAPASRDLVGTLPAPFSDVPTLIESFKNRSLDTADLVALSGAHTVGRGHCGSFSDRLPPNADDTIDPVFRQKLAAKCANDPKGTVTQVLDVRTPNAFDNKYYFDLIAKQGLFKSDQGLMNHPATKRMATRFSLNQAAFFDQFSRSMVKMSQMDVLTGNAGEIRLNCAARNSRVSGLDAAGDEGLAADA